VLRTARARAAESSIRAGFDALVNRLGVRPRIAAEVDDMALLRLLARERIGLAVVPTIVVRDELEARLLVEIAPFCLSSRRRSSRSHSRAGSRIRC